VLVATKGRHWSNWPNIFAAGKPGHLMSRTGRRPYRRNRAIVLAASDLCIICGHPGARTAEHVVPHSLGGTDDVDNLAPSHGTMGPHPANPCPTCGRLCNQSQGNGLQHPDKPVIVTYRSRDW
jgi:hypothetical protein